MIAVSDYFKNAIKNVSNREIKGYVELEYKTFNERKQYYQVSSNNESEFSNVSQILDNDKMKNTYLTLEEDYFNSEEAFFLPNANNLIKIGYISNDILEPIVMDGENRVSITIQPKSGVTINSSNCIPNQLTIYFKDGHPLMLNARITYTDNTTESLYYDVDKDTFSFEIDTTKYIKRVDLLLYAWSERRRARIQQIDFGLSEVYKDKDLISFDLIEQVSKFVEEVPANELNVILNNIDNRFNPINPDGIVKYLTDNLVVKPYLGIVTDGNGLEFVSCGIYNLKDWQNNNDSTTTLICRNIIDKLQNQEFENKTGGLFSISLGETNFKNYLQNNYDYDFVFNWKQYKSSFTYWTMYEKLIDFLSESTLRFQSIIKGNRLNQIEIKAIDNSIKDVLDRNELLNEPNYTIMNRISQVSIVRPYYSLESQSADVVELLTTSVTLTKPEQVFRITSPSVSFFNVESVSQSGASSASIVEKGYREIFIKVTGTVGSSVSLTLRGIKATYTETETTEIHYGDKLSNNNIFTFKSDLNMAFTMEAVAKHILDNDNSYKISLEYSGNPAHEAGDTITVPTKYGDKDLFIEKLTLKYDGGLSGTIDGVGN